MLKNQFLTSNFDGYRGGEPEHNVFLTSSDAKSVHCIDCNSEWSFDNTFVIGACVFYRPLTDNELVDVIMSYGGPDEFLYDGKELMDCKVTPREGEPVIDLRMFGLMPS